PRLGPRLGLGMGPTLGGLWRRFREGLPTAAIGFAAASLVPPRPAALAQALRAPARKGSRRARVSASGSPVWSLSPENFPWHMPAARRRASIRVEKEKGWHPSLAVRHRLPSGPPCLP